jgi:cell division protein ZapA (FtsZ GTPase activity inhibitor)
VAESREPSNEDWARATTLVVIVDDLGSEDFRAKVRKLSRRLEREGLAAHRNADLLEGRCRVPRVLTKDIPLWEHTRAAVLTKLDAKFKWRHWLMIARNLEELDEAEPDDVDKLRQQAAKLLDAALHIEETVCWYELRCSVVRARDLVNDTIVAIMIAWDYIKWTNVAEQIAAQLRERKISLNTTAITADRLKNAHSRYRKRVRAQGESELTGPLWLPLLRTLRGNGNCCCRTPSTEIEA